MSELRRLCDLAVSLPSENRWPNSTTASYAEAVNLGRVGEWWAALAQTMARMNLPEPDDDGTYYPHPGDPVNYGDSQ
jgi:hypothetical protein